MNNWIPAAVVMAAALAGCAGTDPCKQLADQCSRCSRATDTQQCRSTAVTNDTAKCEIQWTLLRGACNFVAPGGAGDDGKSASPGSGNGGFATADSGTTVKGGGDWNCLSRARSPSAIACAFDWTCYNGVADRELTCKKAAAGTTWTCACRNVRDNKSEGSFTATDNICALAEKNIAFRANKGCNWKMDTQ